MRLMGGVRASRMRGLGAIGTSREFRVKGHTVVPQPGAGDINVALWTTWPWDAWIKPQIDAAVALGANTFSIKGPPDTSLGLTDVRGKYRQFIEYCASKNCYVYVSGGNGPTSDLATYAANIATIASYVNAYPNVIGIDMWNEINIFHSPPDAATAGLDAAQLRNAVKAVTDIPVTVSVANFPNVASDWLAAVSPRCDFLDFHPYADTVTNPVDLSFWRTQSWWKPFIIGEYGAKRADGTTVQTNTYNHLKDYQTQTDCYGAVAFCIASYTSSGDMWGMYDNTMSNPLSSETSAFAAWRTYL